MQHYKNRPDGFKEIKRQMVIKGLPVMLITATVGIMISLVNSNNGNTDVNVLMITIPIVVVAIVLGLYRGINRQKGLFDSYQLTLTNNLITREQFNTPTVSIYFNEVKEIIKNKNGSFTIKGKDSTDLIAIPAQLENYLEVENALSQIKPITTKSKKPFRQQFSMAIKILSLGLMATVYTVANKVIVALSGIILVFILIWNIYEVRKSKNIDAKTKHSMWWVLLALASIIGIVMTKLVRIPKP